MKELTYNDISGMIGNGSSMRTVLRYFIDKGAAVYQLHEDLGKIKQRFFLVKYQELTIPLRAYDLNFYSIYNSAFSLIITNDKLKSQSFLQSWSIPTPETVLCSSVKDADSLFKKYGSCVIKPRVGAHGDGITINVKDQETLQEAFEEAQTVHPEVLVQQQVSGDDHRLLFIDYKFVAAVKRLPASIVGDGAHSIRELVETSNANISKLWADIRSGATGADETKGSISKTPVKEIVAARGEGFLDKVPAAGETVRLIDKANVSLGGQTYDVTDEVNSELTDKISVLLKNIELPFCGVDVLSTDISSPLSENNSFVIELNGAPGLRLHELPHQGQSRPVCAMMAESLINHYRGIN